MKDPIIFLEHVIQCISTIEKYTIGISKNKFTKNELINNLTIRQFEVVGEAMRNLPLEFISKYPEVDWSGYIGLRNKISHGYFEIDLLTLWKIVQDELPQLKNDIQQIIKKEKEDIKGKNIRRPFEHRGTC